MNQRCSRIGRRSFLTSTVGGLAGLSVLGPVASTKTARAQPSLNLNSNSNSDGDWTQRRADADRSSQSLISPVPADDAWMQFGADAGHTSFLRNGVGPKGTLKKAWTKSGTGEFSGVAVVDGTAYVGAEKLVALNAADGSERWTFAPKPPKNNTEGSRVVTHPAVMNGTVYAGVTFSDNGSTKTVATALIAVDAASGNKRRRIDFPGAKKNERLPVMAADRTIFVAASDVEGGNKSWLYAFNAGDGSVRWRQRWRSSDENYIFSDGKIYVDKGGLC